MTYFAKIGRATVHGVYYHVLWLYQHVILCKFYAESFIYGIYLPNMLSTVSYVYTD